MIPDVFQKVVYVIVKYFLYNFQDQYRDHLKCSMWWTELKML